MLLEADRIVGVALNLVAVLSLTGLGSVAVVQPLTQVMVVRSATEKTAINFKRPRVPLHREPP